MKLSQLNKQYKLNCGNNVNYIIAKIIQIKQANFKKGSQAWDMQATAIFGDSGKAAIV